MCTRNLVAENGARSLIVMRSKKNIDRGQFQRKCPTFHRFDDKMHGNKCINCLSTDGYY